MDYRKKAIELREQRGEVCDKASAIVALAESEKRSITVAEQTQIDGFLADGDRLGSEADRYEKLATFQDSLLQNRTSVIAVAESSGSDGVEISQQRKITVPATARHRFTGRLKAFENTPRGEAEAYLSGQFFLATICKNEASSKWCREYGVDTRFYGAMTGSDNTLGGYVIPEEMDRRIIVLREERGVFRREAMIWPMGSDTLNIPRRAGGTTAYFVGDNVEITASDPTLNQVQLVAKKLGALIKLSSEVSEDAIISLADFVTSEIAYSFADKEDECGFNGDGTSTYGGIVGIKNALLAGSEYEALSGNTAFSTLDLVDFESMIGKLPQYAERNAKWYIHRAGWAASMMRLADAAGGNTTSNIMGGVGTSFLGYPVVFTQVMNSTLTAQTSTEGLCYFGDLRMAGAIGTRRGLSLMQSDQRYFELDQLAIKGTQRFDINVHERGTATVAGAMIGLKTPAS